MQEEDLITPSEVYLKHKASVGELNIPGKVYTLGKVS